MKRKSHKAAEPYQLHKCCLCRQTYQGFGNDAWPLNRGGGRCCSFCNFTRVVPARRKLRLSDVLEREA